jgi:hypothetical protein
MLSAFLIQFVMAVALVTVWRRVDTTMGAKLLDSDRRRGGLN